MENPNGEISLPPRPGRLLPWLSRHRELAWLTVTALALLTLCLLFLFTQDDSYITFRYVANFVSGRGLVYNAGEYVEGYTNFLWTMLLALPAAVGGDVVLFSHIFGIGAGLGVLLILYNISRTLTPAHQAEGLSFIALALTSVNVSFAYWAASGMETPLFTLLLLAGVLSYFREYGRRFVITPAVFFLLSLTRPEGMLCFALTATHAAASCVLAPKAERPGWLRRTGSMIAIYALPLALFTLWRLSYYGYLFPNTFYAKSGLSPAYLNAGIEYTMVFARDYLFFGLLVVLPLTLVLWRRRTWQNAYIIMLLAGYCFYVTLIGGDVLRGHRFFVPIIPLFYLLLQEGVAVASRLTPGTRSRAFAPATIVVVAATSLMLVLPSLRSSLAQERGLVDRMAKAGAWLRELPSPPTVAATTIGALGYCSGVPVIDMLGLTDTTIAHHPEYVQGISSSWRERRYNTSYLLARKPDWIFFSTDIKPSAFAERALFTRSEFRREYYPCYIHLGGDFEDIKVVYRRAARPLVTDADSVAAGVEFIEGFNRGINLRRSPGEALSCFLSARASAPRDFALLDEQIGNAYHSLNDTLRAEEAYRRAISINPAMIYSQIMLALYARERNQLDDAQAHLQTALAYNPEYALPWTLLGENRAMAGDTLQAKQFLTEALRRAPNNAEASRYLARLEHRPSPEGGQPH